MLSIGLAGKPRRRRLYQGLSSSNSTAAAAEEETAESPSHEASKKLSLPFSFLNPWRSIPALFNMAPDANSNNNPSGNATAMHPPAEPQTLPLMNLPHHPAAARAPLHTSLSPYPPHTTTTTTATNNSSSPNMPLQQHHHQQHSPTQTTTKKPSSLSILPIDTTLAPLVSTRNTSHGKIMPETTRGGGGPEADLYKMSPSTMLAIPTSKGVAGGNGSWDSATLLGSLHTQFPVAFARCVLLVASVLYGSEFPVTKILGQTDMPLGLGMAIRFGMSALVMSPWLFTKRGGGATTPTGDATHKTAPKPPAEADVEQAGDYYVRFTSPDERTWASFWQSPEVVVTVAGMEVGLWASIAYISQMIGLQTTPASKSAFFSSMSVVVVPLYDLCIGKSLESRQLMGAGLALSGVAVLEFGSALLSDMGLTQGDLISMIQPFAFGMVFWRLEHILHRYPDQAGRATASNLLSAFMVAVLYCWVENSQAEEDKAIASWQQVMGFFQDSRTVFSLLWTGMITTSFGLYFEAVALQTLSAIDASLILSTEPFSGSLLSTLLLGESFGITAVVGALLIVTGNLYATLGAAGFRSTFFCESDSSTVSAVMNPCGSGDEDMEYADNPQHDIRKTHSLEPLRISTAMNSTTPSRHQHAYAAPPLTTTTERMLD